MITHAVGRITTAIVTMRRPFSHAHLTVDQPMPRRAGTTALLFRAP